MTARIIKYVGLQELNTGQSAAPRRRYFVTHFFESAVASICELLECIEKNELIFFQRFGNIYVRPRNTKIPQER